MLIDRLTEFANAQYQEPYAGCRKQVSPRCPLKNCVMSEYIKNSCSSSSHTDSYQCECCLDEIHYKQVASSYSCPNSCFVYVCKYIHKYASEIYKALEEVNLPNDRTINVLSLGCGPASELCAFDKLQEDRQLLNYNYTGVDLNPNWQPLHNFYKNDITVADGNTINFVTGDANLCIRDEVIRNTDIIILNYFLSDMVKYAGRREATQFIQNLLASMQRINHFPSLIYNDIAIINWGNSSAELIQQILNPSYSSCIMQYFESYSTRVSGTHLQSARFNAYKNAQLQFATPNYCDKYNPYRYLGSAQIILQQR